MKVGFIGAGKVGFSLGRYFADNGIELSGYYSRTRRFCPESRSFTGSELYSISRTVLFPRVTQYSDSSRRRHKGDLQCPPKMLEQCGFTADEALAALEPLAMSNIRRIFAVGPTAALTGPIERNDVSTVKKHIACIDGNR